MAKTRYNAKSRQVVQTIVDNSATKNIELDLDAKGHYDESNELVLPSKKRKTKIKQDKNKVTKILSNKQRKRLEKIVEKKKKKEKREKLLEALQQVQATPEELSQLTSIAAIQTKGLKRFFQEEIQPQKAKKPKRDLQILSGEINSIKGANKGKSVQAPLKKKYDDPNVAGFPSSDSESDDDEEESEVEKSKSKENNNKEPETDEVTKKQNITIVNNQTPVKIEVKEKLSENKNLKNIIERKPAIHVNVNRSKNIQEARLKLPILAQEQEIMECINENSVVIIAGETGSGKTTQLPQFLYEAGYALEKQIGITEPRRVAAISMSKRVAEEMSLTEKEVSYLIRFEGNATDNTKIKFMTDGVLLKEIKNDFLLLKYSVIIIDEAHERSVYTDVLIGMLSRIVPARAKRNNPLKLIIMSATLRVEDFTSNEKLFKNTPPVIKVDSRQFTVETHYNKRTSEEYLLECYKKAVKVHTTLPSGGILIFVTGQQEVNCLVNKLRKKFPYRSKNIQNDEDIDEKLDKALKTSKKMKRVVIPEINLDDYSIPDDRDISDEEEFSDYDFLDDDHPVSTADPLWVLPLYSMLPTERQNKVFLPPPRGCRLCVVSTNVAETSLTIPNIKYVIDCGKTKVKLYDKVTGVSSYVVTWTSKASADQRKGRAGRTGPGHCYRLYSSAVFNDEFPQFSVPEIQQKPVDDIFLQLKCLHIAKVVNFPFPSTPDLKQLEAAESRLEILGALKEGRVTPLGKSIATFPVLARFGKMLALSNQHGILPYTICIVAALSVQEVLIEKPISETECKESSKKWLALRRQWAGTDNFLLLGDVMVLLRAVGAAEYANSQQKLEEFCTKNGLRHKALLEIRKLRLQLTDLIKMKYPEVDIVVDPQLKPPTDLQAKLLRQILLSGMGDLVAKKIESSESKLKYAYQINNMESPVFIHSGSVLSKVLPKYVICQEVYETNRMYMRGVTAIEPEWLPMYVPHLCNLSTPLLTPEPFYDSDTGTVYCTVNGSFGTQGWTLTNVEIEHPKTGDYYKWFVKFLLEGVIFKKLERYKSSLLNSPVLMVKSYGKFHSKTEAIWKAIAAKNIDSKEKLEEVWKKNPNFLLTEYLQWIPQASYSEVTLLWPPLD